MSRNKERRPQKTGKRVSVPIPPDNGYLGNGEFTNCRIIFTEKPVQLTHAMFKNCVFELPITDNPSPFIRQVSRTLLASNLSSVSMATL